MTDADSAAQESPLLAAAKRALPFVQHAPVCTVTKRDASHREAVAQGLPITDDLYYCDCGAEGAYKALKRAITEGR